VGPGDPDLLTWRRCARSGAAESGRLSRWGDRAATEMAAADSRRPWLTPQQDLLRVAVPDGAADAPRRWPGSGWPIGCGGGGAPAGGCLLCEGMCRCLPAPPIALLALRERHPNFRCADPGITAWRRRRRRPLAPGPASSRAAALRPTTDQPEGLRSPARSAAGATAGASAPIWCCSSSAGRWFLR